MKSTKHYYNPGHGNIVAFLAMVGIEPMTLCLQGGHGNHLTKVRATSHIVSGSPYEVIGGYGRTNEYNIIRLTLPVCHNYLKTMITHYQDCTVCVLISQWRLLMFPGTDS